MQVNIRDATITGNIAHSADSIVDVTKVVTRQCSTFSSN